MRVKGGTAVKAVKVEVGLVEEGREGGAPVACWEGVALGAVARAVAAKVVSSVGAESVAAG